MNTKKLFLMLFCTVLVLAILTIPTAVFATSEPIELSEADFDEARTSEVQPTESGIYYTAGDQENLGFFELEPGEYKLTANVDLNGDRLELSEGDFVLDLNGNALESNIENGPVLEFYDGNLTIKGEGVIHNTSQENQNIMYFFAGDDIDTTVVLEDNIYQGYVYIEDGTNCTINGGEFSGYMYIYDSIATIEDFFLEKTLVIDNSTVTINNGIILCEDDDAIYVCNGSSLTINGGVFASNIYFALYAEPGFWEDVENVAKITICDGFFIGKQSALRLYYVDNVVLKGGRFIIDGEDEYARGAISAVGEELEGLDLFLSFLGEGYMYEEDLELRETGDAYCEEELSTQNKVTVIYAGLDITDGDGQEFVGDDLTVTCSGLYTNFIGLVRDGEEDVDPENYGLESGSTILTLKASYLASLDAGVHTFTMLYTNDRSIDFTVTIPEPEPSITPETGDNIAVYITLFVVAAFGTVVLFKKK